ncbi:MAG TPA: RNA polymerase sigma factor, partial [Polyangia bacterium]|nr:RNA polymerase sigma factor [Polyangia bacterium]
PDTMTRAVGGERAAIERLLSVMQRPFYNLALRMIGDRALAEDATQECLLRVMTHLSQYRSEAKLSTWATRIAVNVIFDFKSGMARDIRYTFASFAEKLGEGRDETAQERPEDALLLKEAKTKCSRALLQCLDGDARVTFVLGEILEFEADEAAAILGIRADAYRKRLSRARTELTAFLARECGVHTAGNGCACHKRLAHAIKIGRLDPKQLEVRIADLKDMRVRLALLDSEPRTDALYRADETPDLRQTVLDSVRAALFEVSA